MKKIIPIACLSLSLVACSKNSLNQAIASLGSNNGAVEAKHLEPKTPVKYNKALVFQGGGVQTAVFLGMLDGARSEGYNPDVIIGTCGSSMAAAVIGAFPDAEGQRNYVESKEFYNMITQMAPTKDADLLGALNVIRMMHQATLLDYVPDIFKQFMFRVPQNFGSTSDSLDFSALKTKTIMVSSRLEFGPEDVGDSRKGKKWFTETYFTDPDTAYLLKDFESPIAKLYPNSTVNLKTATVTDTPTFLAARASISDPYYMQPARSDNNFYLTGAIDLYPNEVAYTVANEVLEAFSGGFDTFVSIPADESVFRYDDNARLSYVNDQYADYWIDESDFDSLADKNDGLNPSFSWKSLGIRSTVPSDYNDYIRRVEAEWEYGRERAIEALRRPVKNDKSHIRVLDKHNSSQKLRDTIHPPKPEPETDNSPEA